MPRVPAFRDPSLEIREHAPSPSQNQQLKVGAHVALPMRVQPVVETPNMFAPVSTPAFLIRDVSFFVLAITGVIFIIVAGFTVYTLIRFGRRPAGPEVEPAQVYGSTQIELAWTIVPLLIVVVLFLVTARYAWGIDCRAQPPDALASTV